MASKNSRIIKWTAVIIAALGLLGAAIKFGFMYDRELNKKFVTKEVHTIEVETIKRDIKKVEKKIDNIDVQQRDNTRKLDRVLVILENK